MKTVSVADTRSA